LAELLPLPPPLLLNAVNVGTIGEVGEERMKINVLVAVGIGVSVFSVGVSEGLGVNEGIAAAVRVPATMTVCAIKVLTAPGFTVGTDGVASVGTHAIIRARAATQINNFVLRVAVIFPLPHPNLIRIQVLYYFSTMMAV
jgi:hypothetical protein